MQTLTLQPQVFSIWVKDASGSEYSYEVLTLEGATPKETVYFMKKGDAPSNRDSDQIIEKIENEDWTYTSLSDTDLEIKDFDIDPEILSTAGESYADIYQAMKSIF